MSTSLEDMRFLLPVLIELWKQGRLPTKLYHALRYAPQRDVYPPGTVGEMCKELREQHPRRLLAIQGIGPASITILRELFLHQAEDSV